MFALHHLSLLCRRPTPLPSVEHRPTPPLYRLEVRSYQDTAITLIALAFYSITLGKSRRSIIGLFLLGSSPFGGSLSVVSTSVRAPLLFRGCACITAVVRSSPQLCDLCAGSLLSSIRSCCVSDLSPSWRISVGCRHLVWYYHYSPYQSFSGLSFFSRALASADLGPYRMLCLQSGLHHLSLLCRRPTPWRSIS